MSLYFVNAEYHLRVLVSSLSPSLTPGSGVFSMVFRVHVSLLTRVYPHCLQVNVWLAFSTMLLLQIFLISLSWCFIIYINLWISLYKKWFWCYAYTIVLWDCFNYLLFSCILTACFPSTLSSVTTILTRFGIYWLSEPAREYCKNPKISDTKNLL